MANVFPVKELYKQLEQAKAADKDLKRFGASTHRYRWNPPASLKAVEQFEKKIGVTLPEDYRNFLLQAGNGGAGPFYGLFSLEGVEGWLQWDIEPENPPLLHPDMDVDDLDTEDNTWKRGCIPIESEGDTYFTCLMVTGPNRGRVVYIEYEGSYVFFPKETTFLSWYERWLREIRNHYNIFWFATNLDGDEQELQAYYKQVQTEDEKRYAIHSMDKFPEFSQDTVDFLKVVMLDRLDIEDARGFLLLIRRIGSDFLHQFLERRWQAGHYDAVVREISYAQSHIQKEQGAIAQKWSTAVMEKLPQFSPDAQPYAMQIIEGSKSIKLEQVKWVFEHQTSKIKKELLPIFARFEDAAEHLDIWLDALKERENLDLLDEAICTVPKIPDPQLKDSILQIQKDFAFAVELLHVQDYNDEEEMKQSMQRNKENRIYRSACSKWKKIWYEELNPEVIGIPRPYRLRYDLCTAAGLSVEESVPSDEIAIHPVVAWAIRNQFRHLPSTAFDWERMLGRIKRLLIYLDNKTVQGWDEKTRSVALYPPDEFQAPKPFCYNMSGWSVIGEMKKLKTLSISEICIEDFSFLPQCQSLEQLSLYNTNFSDCRMLLELPNLKRVDLRLCRLEHTEALKEVPFECILKGER